MNLVRKLIDALSIYLPLAVLGLLALGSYLLVKNTPAVRPTFLDPPPKHVPDYFMRDFALRSFDANGQLKSEMFGKELRHYPDTDTVEIDAPRMQSRGLDGRLSNATALKAISNADGSEVQLLGNAKVQRDTVKLPDGSVLEPMQITSEFLHVYANTERVTTNKRVTVLRGQDTFSADSLAYDHIEGMAELTGKARGSFAPKANRP